MLSAPAATATVPNFSLSSPVDGQKISSNLTVNGYSSNVDIDAFCTIPNLAPFTTFGQCDYNNRWVSVGYVINSALAEGSYTMSVVARDRANPSHSVTISRQVVVDRTPPSVWITSGPAAGSTIPGNAFSFGFSASETSTFECKLDDGAFAPCTNPYSVGAVADGNHTVTVQAFDGLHYGTTNRSFSVNNAPPVATVSSVNGDAYAGGTVSSGATVDLSIDLSRDDALVECRTDAGSWGGCGTFGPLSDGAHTIEVRAYLAGPTDVQDPPVSVNLDVDATPPAISFAGVDVHQAGSTAEIPWTADEPLSYTECRIDNEPPYNPCPTSFSAVGAGQHTLSFFAVDEVGNETETLEFVFHMYPSAPNTFVNAGQNAAQAVEAASFTFTSSTAGASFQCRVDLGAWSACTSPLTLSVGEYPAGAHGLEVRAVDPVGQVDATPATAAFTLNASTPAVVPAPKLGKLRAKGKKVSVTASAVGSLKLTVESCKRKTVKKKKKTVCKRVARASATSTGAGVVTFKLKKSLKKRAKYKLTVTATSSSGDKSKLVKTVKAG